MDVENKDAEPATDLRLALGNSNNTTKRRLNNDSGAGANAASNMDMTFVATDPLSELVWCPQRGLSVKCTEQSFLDKKPSYLSGAGPSNVFFPARVVGTDKRIDQDYFGKSMFHTDTRVSSLDAFQSLSFCAEIGRASSSGDEGKKGERRRLQIEAGELQVPRDESTLFKEEETKKAMKKCHFSSHCLFEKLETAAENDFPSMMNKKGHVATSKIGTSESDLEVRRKSQQDEVDLSSIINCGKKYKKKKKKKKALSDENVEGRASEAEDDSHESVESCNSAGISRLEKRRWSFEQQMIVGSKRVKQQIQETPGSSSFIRQDSSFMNLISNMVKGSPKPKPEVPALALTLSDCNQGLENPHQDLVTCNENTQHGFQNNGFRSIFHSIYSPKLRVQEPRAPDENDMLELDIACNICETDATPVACNGEIFPLQKDSEAGSGKQVEVPPSGGIKINVACGAQKDGTNSSSSMGKGMILAPINIDSDPAYDVSYRSDPLGNAWITRFIPKILSAQDTMRKTANGTPEFPNYLMVSRHQYQEKPLTGSNEEFTTDFSINTSSRLKNSEAMASLFARRLDALKHIVSFGVPENAAVIPTTCFFCGKKGHRLRECSEITEADLNMKPCSGVDEFPFLCIRCFQLDHWAVSCPNASASASSRALSHTNQASIGAQTIYSTLDSKACHDLNHLMTATGLQETFKASSWKEGFTSPLDRFTGEKPKGIFDAIKKLRLSRTDILRCMSSQMTLSSLDGFFVRLRLGKWQEGLPRTGYCVACISEENEEIRDARSKSCIHMNVGGFKVLVESQYISNHDFLEDELEAWWSTTACNTPSEEGLRNKPKKR